MRGGWEEPWRTSHTKLQIFNTPNIIHSQQNTEGTKVGKNENVHKVERTHCDYFARTFGTTPCKMVSRSVRKFLALELFIRD